MAKHRTRRLRKKLHVGEFRQFGFEVSFRLPEQLSESDLASFWDRFILEAIEANGLAYGGGTSGFATGWGRATATDDHRQFVISWLAAQPEVSSVVTGELIDAWHSP
jgi:uncharacterized protein YggL (DUF469 family)